MKRLLLTGAFLVTAVLGACDREQRNFEQPPAAPQLASSPYVGSEPSRAVRASSGSYEETAYAISQGKQLFNWFNCAGCHAHGGGNIGPPLMDAKWIYGEGPDQIFASIVDGRPNGMPSFRGRIADSQVWQLVAYVRSMSGLVRRDAISGRDDGIQKGKPEQRRDPLQPIKSAEPPAQ